MPPREVAPSSWYARKSPENAVSRRPNSPIFISNFVKFIQRPLGELRCALSGSRIPAWATAPTRPIDVYIHQRELDCSTNYKNISAHSPLIDVYIGTCRTSALLSAADFPTTIRNRPYVSPLVQFSAFYTVVSLGGLYRKIRNCAEFGTQYQI